MSPAAVGCTRAVGDGQRQRVWPFNSETGRSGKAGVGEHSQIQTAAFRREQD